MKNEIIFGIVVIILMFAFFSGNNAKKSADLSATLLSLNETEEKLALSQADAAKDVITPLLRENSQKTYDNESYNCVNFSIDAKKILNVAGFESDLIYIDRVDDDNLTTAHEIISVTIYIDPQNLIWYKKSQLVNSWQTIKNDSENYF